MSIRQWPESERPREKLMTRGPTGLSDAELLAIFLRTGCAGRSAVDLGRELITRFGGLRGLMAADVETFVAVRGLGRVKYAQLQAVVELASRCTREVMTREQLAGPQHARDYLASRLRDLPHEVFAMICLDKHNRLLGFDELSRGTLDAAAVYPREVVRTALQRNAASVILAHNHPSGVSEPSCADRQITTRLRDALATVEIDVLDHIVIGDACVSFADRGLL